nr:AlNc14C166G7874 [Albugo laibachii Nc14]|eukprot:CCA22730.1 AlNc14C166G7874 [Albugo laibachii Nc14]
MQLSHLTLVVQSWVALESTFGKELSIIFCCTRTISRTITIGIVVPNRCNKASNKVLYYCG